MGEGAEAEDGAEAEEGVGETEGTVGVYDHGALPVAGDWRAT